MRHMGGELTSLKEAPEREHARVADACRKDFVDLKHESAGFGQQSHYQSQTQDFVDKTFGVPTIESADGIVYLQGQISNVPEISEGITSIDDLRDLGAGIATGLQSAVQESLQYLSTPNAVHDSLLNIGPALDNAVNYYATTSAQQLGSDANQMLAAVSDSVEGSIGVPLRPGQRGERAGALLPVFLLERL